MMRLVGAEKDSCGVGFVAHQQGHASHRVVSLALEALGNHTHRGAVAADGKTGDGSGLMTQIPHAFFARVYTELTGKKLEGREWTVGCVFLPLGDARGRNQARRLLEQALREHGLEALAWREVPLGLDTLGRNARALRPHIQQVYVARNGAANFETALYRARRSAERQVREAQIDDFYVASLSSRTLIYKGLCTADTLGDFFPDLRQPDFVSAVALFHQRYSTNTFPSWHLAQPFRMICHNGEFNTLQANSKWMRAREVALDQQRDADLLPVISPGVSDSGAFDNVLEFFTQGGRDTLPCLLMMMPELWENVPPGGMPQGWQDLYRYLSCLMEPWEGPAALAFFDGRYVGALLDRNGLRPMRYTMFSDGLTIASSEAGCVAVDESLVVKRGMLGPGEIIALDTQEKRWHTNHELKEMLSRRHPYGEWMKARQVELPTEPGLDAWLDTPSKETLRRRQLAFGFNHEDEVAVLKPMWSNGAEPVGSMGDDTPPAALSAHGRPLFHYFRQRFAQVTNPPIDSLREKLVMSLRTWVGRRANVLTEEAEVCRLVELPGPVLDTHNFRRLMTLSPRPLPHIVLHTVWPVHSGPSALEERLEQLCSEAEEAVRQGATMVVLYDGGVNSFRAPIPSLLAVSAVHHRLLEAGLRLNASLIVVSGEPREVHHFACLLGYGADAIFPYLVLDTIAENSGHLKGEAAAAQAGTRFIQAVHNGLLKIMAKMGISVLSSYRAGQVFESLGLDSGLVERYFPDTPCWLGGMGLHELASVQAEWHGRAFADEVQAPLSPGFYKFKKDGERHRFSPSVVKALHAVVQAGSAVAGDNPFDTLRSGVPGYAAYLAALQAQGAVGLRDLLGFVHHRPALPLTEVEPLEAIVRRFSTGAMSHGSLSSEAHSTLSVAMNRLGAASNCGEGGEAPERYSTLANSRIKQIASGRFGVTPAYLLSADELQIKMAQGSKPGEGGQIPGHKVTAEIARVRHTVPGVDLISPPPHHDIYSIEDLAQLIHDLKRFHPVARISVKLVSEEGVGTVAAGVAKASADIIQISGSDGGTGASPLSSIKFAGMPWELGLAQAQQTLVANELRGQVRLRVDGGFQSGRDVVIAALLGADEFAFGTSALVAEGCLMARACHNNTCPVGIASQDTKLRAKYPGTPDGVMTFMLAVAGEVREILASLGARSIGDVVGRTELLEQVVHGEAAGFLELDVLLDRGEDDQARAGDLDALPRTPRHGRDLDAEVIARLETALGTRTPGAPRDSSSLRFGELADASAGDGQPDNSAGEGSLVGARQPLEPAMGNHAAADGWAAAQPSAGCGNSLISAQAVQQAACWEDSSAFAAAAATVAEEWQILNTDRAFGTRLSGYLLGRFGRHEHDCMLPAGSLQLRLRGSAGQSFGAFGVSALHLELTGQANDYVGKGLHGGLIVLRPERDLGGNLHWIAGNTVLYGATGGKLLAAGRVGMRLAVRNSGAVAVVEGAGEHACEYMTGGAVVILGSVGRNLGAAMTGGRVFVFDPDGEVLDKLNADSVAAERPDADSAAFLRSLLDEHEARTGSSLARRLLDDWSFEAGRFWLVAPKSAALPAAVVKREVAVAGASAS